MEKHCNIPYNSIRLLLNFSIKRDDYISSFVVIENLPVFLITVPFRFDIVYLKIDLFGQLIKRCQIYDSWHFG